MSVVATAHRKKAWAALGIAIALGPLSVALGSSSAPPARAATRTARGPAGQTGAGGLIRMTEGGLEMQMTPLSGQAPTWADIQHVYTTVSIAAAATAPYKDLATAKRDGYRTAPDLFVEHQGMHYYNVQYLKQAESGTFDPAHPPFLVYNTMNGRPTLSGLMFYLPASMTPRQLATIFPASLASWHQHINVCVGGGTSLLNGTAILHYYDAASCTAHGGHFDAATGWMVHTWIGQANGSSLFAMDMAPAKAGRMPMMSPPATQR